MAAKTFERHLRIASLLLVLWAQIGVPRDRYGEFMGVELYGEGHTSLLLKKEKQIVSLG